jgi:hypothetical protein
MIIWSKNYLVFIILIISQLQLLTFKIINHLISIFIYFMFELVILINFVILIIELN